MGKRVESFTNRCLDQVIDRLKLPSDYALAGVLDITPQSIHKLRGGVTMSATTAVKVAELLELDPLKVISEAELERGSDPDIWKRIAKRAAVVLLGAVGVQIAAPPSPAQAAEKIVGPVYYVKSRRKGFVLLTMLSRLAFL